MCVHAWPENDALFPGSFTGFLSEQSQDECWEPTQTPGLSSNEPVERRGVDHLLFGVSAHGALPTTVHSCLLWEMQGDLEDHGANLALCPPASRGPDAEASQGNLTSSAGWA